MRVALIVHVGETYGHLIRGLELADALTGQGHAVEFVASPSAGRFLAEYAPRYSAKPVPWEFSHNGLTPAARAQWIAEAVRTTQALQKLLREDPPDLAVGLPGIMSFPAARAEGVPHVSVLHGPYLSPVVDDSGLTPVERSVIAAGRAYFRAIDVVYESLSAELGLEPCTYDRYLRTESIFVPQPDLPLLPETNAVQVDYVRASYGPLCEDSASPPAETCYVTFGSGNPCDLTQLLDVASEVFPNVIHSWGSRPPRRRWQNVELHRAVAASSLAGHAKWVVSHGGIGTVGTFAEYGTPQLIIPTELDQATMAVWGRRADVAAHAGLEAWVQGPPLGRRMPALRRSELEAALIALRESPQRRKVGCAGARQLASAIARTAAPTRLVGV